MKTGQTTFEVSNSYSDLLLFDVFHVLQCTKYALYLFFLGLDRYTEYYKSFHCSLIRSAIMYRNIVNLRIRLIKVLNST